MLTESECDEFDRVDALRSFRSRFAWPHAHTESGDDVAYLCGHSLGLMPLAARNDVDAVLDAWAGLGVEAHFDGSDPWYGYDDALVPEMALLVGSLGTCLV